jgi:hypothetical protein
MARDTDLEKLHPIVRSKVNILIEKLAKEKIPLRLFEGYRYPQRQQNLYNQGRTTSGPIVTRASAWRSYHQYGVACDFVLYIRGKWSWKTSGTYKKYWKRYHELGAEVGLRPVSFEMPHLELHGLSLNELLAGQYPEGGDESWAENLRTTISNWNKSPTPPPPIYIGRPPLPVDEEYELGSHIIHAQNESTYRVTARSGLRMRGGPGTNFEVLNKLSANQRVQVIQKDGDWYQVDLQNDGLADGYCHAGFLMKVQ